MVNKKKLNMEEQTIVLFSPFILPGSLNKEDKPSGSCVMNRFLNSVFHKDLLL